MPSPKIGFLGPFGTYSDQAVLKYFSRPSQRVDLFPLPSISSVFTALIDNQVDIGIVPIRNSKIGDIKESHDVLSSNPNITIIDSVELDIEHGLVTGIRCLEDVEVVFSHDAALKQCREWVAKNLPRAKLETVKSTGDACRRVFESIREGKEEKCAAICNQVCFEVVKKEYESTRDVTFQKMNLSEKLVTTFAVVQLLQ